MATPIKLEKYQILISPDSKKLQGLRTGDIVRRQYFDGKDTIYSLMCVLENGVTKRVLSEVQRDEDGKPLYDIDGNIITNEEEKDVPYFVGALLEGDAPKNNELLDFARVTNLFCIDRSGALYLTASDDNAPFMDVIDGLARNKSLCWPENISSTDYEDPRSQYIVRGECLQTEYINHNSDNNRIVKLTKTSNSSDFCGIVQEFYELIGTQKRILVSYKARASKSMNLGAEIAYTNGTIKDAEWSEAITEDWKYVFQVINVINSGRHLRTFKLDLQDLAIGDWVEISDFNIILLDSISNFSNASSMRIGKLDGIIDPVYGQLSGYGAYIQKLYASQTTHISGTLTAGDENGFASTFYAGKIHRNSFINSCDIRFITSVNIDNDSLINPTGMGNMYRITESDEVIMKAQTNEWLTQRLNKRYCFSLWAYSTRPCLLALKQNGKAIGTVQIASDQTHEWRRLHLFFNLKAANDDNEEMLLSIIPIFSESLYQGSTLGNISDNQQLFITAPQLEAGESCTQYQPTDTILDFTEDYGAWFARGGIGGTIQNPILRLNYNGNGDIDTRSNSFRLRQDGSGHLANGNISWDQNGKVHFGEGVTLNWENFNSEIKEELTPKFFKIIGDSIITVIGNESKTDEVKYSPEVVQLSLQEIGFTSSSSQRQWYLLCENQWKAIPNENASTLIIEPFSYFWIGEVIPPEDTESFKKIIANSRSNKITLKCEVNLGDEILSDTFEIFKQYIEGFSVQITSSNGKVFRNGSCSTLLTANVYYNGQLLDDEYVLENFDFVWHRYLTSDNLSEVEFEESTIQHKNTLTLDYNIANQEIIICEICHHDGFDYKFPLIFKYVNQ